MATAGVAAVTEPPTVTPVPYDPELAQGRSRMLELFEPIPLRADTILANRAHFAGVTPSVAETIGDRPVDSAEVTVPGPAGAAAVALTILRPRTGTAPGAPGIYGIHGGGMVLGDRAFGVAGLVDDVLRFGAVAASVEYRLAPEHPAPAAAEDCYAGLVWFAEHAGQLGIDPARIVVGGFSAGGGLSAAVALLARDRDGPDLAGQLLESPMLDDRDITVSSLQCDGLGPWERHNNIAAWDAVLGIERGTATVSPYAAPARASDLSGLPPAFVTAGSAEVFRDESAAYASGIWAAGGQAELHVYSGGYHGFSGFSPQAEVSGAAVADRQSWLHRVLGTSSRQE